MKPILSKSVAGLVAMLVLLAGAASASAAQLTTDQARRLAESLPAVQVLAEEIKAKHGDEIFPSDVEIEPGQAFTPYTTATNALKTKVPSGFNQLTSIVKKHGFSSNAVWAGVADRVILAYVASKLPPEMGNMRQMMTPQMLEMMPPAQQAQMQKSFAIMDAIQAVPQVDRDAVAPVIPLLDETLASMMPEGSMPPR